MKPTGFRTVALSVAVPLALGGCAVGPDYHQPAAPAVPGYTQSPLPTATMAADGAPQKFVSGADISGEWWTLYHSPELNSLIDAAIANNPTLAAAQQTLIEAEETQRSYEGSFLPTLTGSFQDQRTRISSAELASQGDTGAASGGNVTVPPFGLYDATLSVSYSPDVFGGGRREFESLQGQTDYQRYELEASYLTLTANVVTAAVTEASYKAQIDATKQIIAADHKQLDILNRQFALGGVPKANILSEQATVSQTEATLPPLESELAQTRNQLADYVGAFPANFHEDDFTLAALHLPADLPVSLPSALVNQRPDIQAAGAQLQTASANVGVAIAEMLPQISLTADVGHEGLNTATLFTPQTLLWSLVAGVTQPIFEGGELNAKRLAAVAALKASGSQYQSTVLAAFQNVADALEILQYDAATLQAAELAEQSAAKSLAVTQDQVQLGGQPFTAELTAQTTYQNAVITRVKAQAARLADTAALFQALGGGWWHRQDVSPAAAQCCRIIPALTQPSTQAVIPPTPADDTPPAQAVQPAPVQTAPEAPVQSAPEAPVPTRAPALPPPAADQNDGVIR
jgi:NodT family efflux transporter outer membrane factor (OMF) lipoprotein